MVLVILKIEWTNNKQINWKGMIEHHSYKIQNVIQKELNRLKEKDYIIISASPKDISSDISIKLFSLYFEV